MPILETIVPVLGSAVAKFLLTTWLGEGLASKLAEEGIDFAHSKLSEVLGRPAPKGIENLAQQMMARVHQRLESAFPNLATGEREAALYEAALALEQAQLTARLLVEFKLNSSRLEQHIRDARPAATRDLSESARTFYGRLLIEVSREMMNAAAELNDFERAFATSVLSSEANILEAVTRLRALPDEAAAKFEQKYRDAVNTRFNKLELFGVPRMDTITRRQRLLRAYTTLQIELWAETEVEHKAQLKDPENPMSMLLPEEALKKESRLVSAEKLLTLARRLVVRGEAGSGKTTLLRWVAVQAANRDFIGELAHWNDAIPFYISLRECFKNGLSFPKPEEFAAYSAPSVSGQMPHGWVHTQLENGRAMVLVDGVDELPRTYRSEMLARLEELVTAYPLARYIISSRPAALKESEWVEWQEWKTYQRFADANLQPMTPEQTGEFITHWFTALAESQDETEIQPDLVNQPDALQRLLQQRPPLQRLAVNPLLCAMICALFHDRQHTLPSGRLKLYSECIEVLLTRRDEGRKIEVTSDYPALTYEHWLALAQGLAYWMMRNNYSEVNVDEAEERFTEHLPAMAIMGVTGAQVRRFLVERANLLREPVLGRIDFAHRTFQEFLAAQAILDEDDLGLLLSHADDDQWRETLIVAAGLARHKERKNLLEGLLGRGDEVGAEKAKPFYLLGVACLETCIELEPALRQRILQQAAVLLPPQDDDEVKLIASAGDPVVALLAEKPDYTDEQAKRCIEVLARIGTPAAMQILTNYAQRCQMDDSSSNRYVEHWDKTHRTLAALGQAWNRFDRVEYAAKVLRYTNVLFVERLTTWEGFDHLAHLRELVVGGGTVEDLNGLVRLTQLQTLVLKRIPVSDVSVLAGLTQLQTLDLSETQVSDVSALAGLTQLQKLDLSDTQVIDLSKLAGLTQLRELCLFSTQVSDVSALAGLTQLRKLYLFSTQVSDVSALAGLTQLRELYLLDTQVSDVSALVGLTQLRKLYLFDTQVSDVSALASLTQLQLLGLSNTQVSNVSGLKLLQANGVKISSTYPLF